MVYARLRPVGARGQEAAVREVGAWGSRAKALAEAQAAAERSALEDRRRAGSYTGLSATRGVGAWGRAHAHIDVHVSGAAARPVIGGVRRARAVGDCIGVRYIGVLCGGVLAGPV